MDFTSYGINWFPYVPKYGGNRDLPDEEKVTLEIRKIPTSAVMSQGNADGTVFAWQEKELKRLKMLGDVSQELISDFDSMSESSLGDVRQFCRYARGFKNVKIDGKRIADPLLIALTVPLHADPETGQTFYHEILSAQNQTIGLHGDELKNFVSACAGEVKETPHAEETET